MMTGKINSNDPVDPQFGNSDNYTIDIDKIYTDFIQQIDACRSMVNITNPANSELFNNLLKSDITSDILSKFRAKVLVEKTPQESRCHTFYRLLGFPVVKSNNANDYYNPGHDVIPDSKKILTDKAKNEILKGQTSDFFKFSTNREKYLLSIASTFSKNQSLEASVLALSSGTKSRKFADTLSKFSAGPFDTDDNLQSVINLLNNIDTTAGRSGAKLFSLFSYIDENGNPPFFSDTSLYERKHILAPFLVDPRIDITVMPASRKVAVPFVSLKSQLRIGENDYVKRPFIEKVIRDRLTIITKNIDDSIQTMKSKVEAITSITDSSLLNSVASFKIPEQYQFYKYLSIITTMIEELVKAQNTIDLAQGKYYWLPIPAKNGPEGGCSIRDVFVSQSIYDHGYETSRDKELRNLKIANVLNNNNIATESVNGKADIGQFVFSDNGNGDSFQASFDLDGSTAIVNDFKGDYDHANSERTQILTDAGNSLRTIEIIMGEFSGLGLCDILAIFGALYTMPMISLNGLLDADAYQRMSEQLGIQEDQKSISDSMNDFILSVRSFYDLMDKIYLDLKNNRRSTLQS